MKDEGSDPVAYTVVFLIFLTTMTGLFAAYKGFVFPPLSEYWFNFSLSTVLYAAGVILWFKALKHIESSEAAIIASFGSVVTIVSAIIFLGDSFVLRQGIGVALIIVSIYLLNSVKRKFHFTLYSGWALLSSACYGLAATSDLYILSHGYDAVSFVPVMSITPALLIILFRPRVLLHVKGFMRSSFIKSMFFMTLFYSIQAIAYYVAFENGGLASQISPISKSSIILTVILAVIFLKERTNLRLKLLSAGLVTVGVLLIK